MEFETPIQNTNSLTDPLERETWFERNRPVKSESGGLNTKELDRLPLLSKDEIAATQEVAEHLKSLRPGDAEGQAALLDSAAYFMMNDQPEVAKRVLGPITQTIGNIATKNEQPQRSSDSVG